MELDPRLLRSEIRCDSDLRDDILRPTSDFMTQIQNVQLSINVEVLSKHEYIEMCRSYYYIFIYLFYLI